MPLIDDSFLDMVRDVRAIPGRDIGARPHTVALATITWSGTHTGDGNDIETTTDLTEGDGQPPKIRWLNDEQLAVGGLSDGEIEIGPITPSGDVDLSQIRFDDAETGDQTQLIITGPKHPNGARYRITRITADRATQWRIRARPVEG